MRVFDFQPSQQAPFQFQPVLDGQAYTAIITFNLFGRRPYLNLYALDGTLVVSIPVVGSEIGRTLQSLTWSRGIVSVVTALPHNYRIGSTVSLTVSGVVPDGYNGRYDCLVTSRTEFQYDLPANPGQITQPGAVSYDISLVAGYFASTIVYRAPSRQFEVSP